MRRHVLRGPQRAGIFVVRAASAGVSVWPDAAGNTGGSEIEEPVSRILLRPWRAEDAPVLLTIAGRTPDLERQLPYPIDSPERAAQWIREMGEDPGRHVFAIVVDAASCTKRISF